MSELCSPDNPPPEERIYNCPCGSGIEPCPVDGVPACMMEETDA